MEGTFHQQLKLKTHKFVTFCYEITKKFPKSELYGTVSQLRRASMSIMLNYVEGYARRRPKVKLNFYETSHGSTQESKYVIFFAQTQTWINKEECNQGLEIANEVAKMLWSIIDNLEQDINTNQ
jgi:four helix bundle protein